METSESADTYVRLDFSLDGGISHRAAIGLVVLATDHTIEYEWRKLLALDGVGFYESRIANSAEITPETLAQMDGLIAPGVEVIRPGERLDVVAFGCTSASMVLGEEKVFERIKEARPNAACTTPITAARVGLNALGTRRIALLTPYVRRINESMRDYLGVRGIDVVRTGSFEHSDDNEVARIDSASVRQAVLSIGRHDAVDAVFVSCTSLRLADDVVAIEQELGKPVTSSNHAMAWHALRLGGVNDSLPQFGRLFAV
ncbi:Maleate isomerase [Paraburkholderia aspalathi]|uniref:Maleate isomerase n=1 Tax=Paraburkholderia aspalathi TaxID=1324617 RepID=A0ABN7ND50_9BURK|nr:Asp/Glu racemase [Paraburkholderia aspalathi]MBK3823720.1 Asp/Glu racemase [Paraburkholderia aspalathi]MBK3835569.1 Asp/Glu racemase [Paraburkholderia aspalathi]MBK3844548.1 Asp/Glu racemase [Paraburkholderia aspalathi]MBK3865321.1 Asp/Glu racemase [Paraburkholderia aspalathi]CAE6856343.1 Maleate isomerase [Paraburkholderia aspalathi]